MRIYGVDFTSAPCRRKPIVVACAALRGNTIIVEQLRHFTTRDAWADWLRHPGTWIMGCDFPFGLPRRFIASVGWPETWEDCVQHIAALPKSRFESTIAAFRDAQKPGKKHPLRLSDQYAGACSPLMVFGTPVAKMFYVGAPCLAQAPISIAPCRPQPVQRVALEVYPGIVARTLLGKAPYKGNSKHQSEAERRQNRVLLLEAVENHAYHSAYGHCLQTSPAIQERMVEDSSGDSLDAVLCLLPTAWASRHKADNYGIPEDADPLEGWLVDPTTQQ